MSDTSEHEAMIARAVKRPDDLVSRITERVNARKDAQPVVANRAQRRRAIRNNIRAIRAENTAREQILRDMDR